MTRGTRVVVLLTVAVVACGSPIRVRRVSSQRAYRSITASALSTDRASEWSRGTVNEWGLLEQFDERPEETLAQLHEIVTSGRGGSHELFALAELSLLHGDETGNRAYDLAAAVYAYAFLFPERSADIPSRLDPRTRLATDVYNRAIATAFASQDGRTVDLRPGTYPVPFGVVDVYVNPAEFDWGDRRLVDFTPLSEIEITGMRNRHRLPGLGAALAAHAIPRPDVDVQKSLLAPGAWVAATALLRLDDVHHGLATGRLRGSLELYTASETDTVTVEGHDLPLEREDTAAIAVQLARAPVWEWELWGFLGRAPTGIKLPVLRSLDPYRPGRIPVVFVHGTQSSPGRWADMANDLLADPWIRQRYQFFFFMYNTGNPIAYSGMLLRDRLTEVLARMDPDGRDPCLHEMVVIGHSQGGLLTKLTAVDTGDRLWNAIFRVPPDQVPASPEFHALLQKSLFVTPLPFVHRVVFIATPHRGSFLTGEFVNRLVSRVVRLPANVVSLSTDTLTKGGDVFADRQAARKLPTAVDNMTAGNPFLMGLAAIPVAPGIPYHSIIAVKPEFQVVEDGNDGVVQYRSAHLDGAASELVVRSPHSCQANPHTVQEVRRILHLHGEAVEAAGIQCGPVARP